MLKSTSIQQQYEKATEDNLRVLIIGAGIAGITAAQMLRKDGRHPVLIERNADESNPGYMLALMPVVDAVLDDLELQSQYREQSVALERYGLFANKGGLIREDSLVKILNRYGDYRGISRGELLKVLTDKGCEVTFDTLVTSMDTHDNTTRATLRTGDNTCHLDFDIVIVADGIHSSTRDLVLNDKIDIVDTKWGGWVVWAPGDKNMDLCEELWGAGFFFGAYPVKGNIGVFLGGPRKDTRAGHKEFVQGIRKKLTKISPRLERCLQAVTDAADPYFWSLNDCRSPRWTIGRTILLGDSAAGFLPTAGIGAGMAMESAWMLTRMLRFATQDNVNLLLRKYEESQRPRVEAAQENSRSLAGIMFHESKTLAVIRDIAMRLVSAKMVLRPIQKLLASQPNPDHIAQKALQNQE